MDVLVTGGCGFIGCTLVPTLIGQGHRVFVVDDLSAGTDPQDLIAACCSAGQKPPRMSLTSVRDGFWVLEAVDAGYMFDAR